MDTGLKAYANPVVKPAVNYAQMTHLEHLDERDAEGEIGVVGKDE